MAAIPRRHQTIIPRTVRTAGPRTRRCACGGDQARPQYDFCGKRSHDEWYVASGCGCMCPRMCPKFLQLVARSSVPHLRLQLLEEILDYDQLARSLPAKALHHHEPLIVRRHVIELMQRVRAKPWPRKQHSPFAHHKGGGVSANEVTGPPAYQRHPTGGQWSG